MKVAYIENTKRVRKTKKELERDYPIGSKERLFLMDEYKEVRRKEPVYIVEMTAKELQLVSFYLELENRKPITNVEIEAKLEKEKL